MVPESVYKECIIEGKDRPEVELLRNAEWIKVSRVKNLKLFKLLRSSIDEGESGAIALAIESGAGLILLDDSDAREKARLYGLKITGTLGIILRAKREGKIPSLKKVIVALKEGGFWIDNMLEKKLLINAEIENVTR